MAPSHTHHRATPADQLWGDPFGAPTFVPPDEDAMLHVLDHPLRLRVLGLITAAPLTPREVARATGRTWQEALYHLRMLDAAGYAEVADPHGGQGNAQARGSLEGEQPPGPVEPADDASVNDPADQRYRANPHWTCARALRRERQGLPAELDRDELVTLNRVLWSASAASAQARLTGLPDGADVWLADAHVTVPRAAWERALELLKEATRLVHSAAVPEGTPGAVLASFTVCAQPWWHTAAEDEQIRAERARYRARFEPERREGG